MQGVITSLIITVCVAIVYWLDAPNDIASRVMSLIMGRDIRVTLKKPLGCNTCMTFWLTLVALLILSPVWWWLAFVWAWSAKYFHYIIEVIDRLIVKVCTLIMKRL